LNMKSTARRTSPRSNQIALAIASAFLSSVTQAQTAGTVTTLPPVTVTADRVDGYSPRTTSAGTRTTTPIENIPHSVVVIDKQIIEDQGSSTLSDVLRNVSNVSSIDARESNLTGFDIRGFSSSTIVDGVMTPGIFQNQESLIGVEQISVIKGPAGGLYGGSQGMNYSSIGGSIVISTVAPEQSPIKRVGLKAGNFNQKGAAFDLNQPLSSSVAVRLTGEYSDSDSETKNVYFKRRSISPSIALTPSRDTKVVLRLRDIRNETLDYPGLPRATAGSATLLSGVSRDLFIGASGLPPTTNDMQGANLQWTQRLNEKWDFGLTLANNKMKLDQRGAFAGSVIDAFVGGFYGDQFGLGSQDIYGYWLKQDFDSKVASPSLTGKLKFGDVSHTVTVGVDHEKSSENSFLYFSDPLGLGISPFTGFVPISLASYVAPTWVDPAGGGFFDASYRRDFSATTAYVQDQMDIGKWSFLGSLRQSKIKVTNTTGTGTVTSANEDDVTPRVGAVYKFTPKVSMFAGYGEAVKTPTLTSFTTGEPALERSKQYEVGVRFIDAAGFSGSVAVFDLSRENVATSGAGGTTYPTNQGSKGIDIDLRWNATKNWKWLIAYTSQEVEYTGAGNAAVASYVGRQLFGTPEQSLRLATRYDVRAGQWSGLGVGLGVTNRSKLPGDGENTFFTSAVTLWDAQVSYELKNVRLGLNVANLLDKQYMSPSAYFGGGQLLPGMPRTVTATATVSF
jgi:iron complex outermembrane receptor protein